MEAGDSSWLELTKIISFKCLQVYNSQQLRRSLQSFAALEQNILERTVHVLLFSMDLFIYFCSMDLFNKLVRVPTNYLNYWTQTIDQYLVLWFSHFFLNLLLKANYTNQNEFALLEITASRIKI